MATKVCTSCKKIMRFEDTHCRTCGKEYKQTIPKWMIVVVVIATLALSFVFATPNTSVSPPEKTAQIKAIEQQTQSRMALQGTLKDSSGAEIRPEQGAGPQRQESFRTSTRRSAEGGTSSCRRLAGKPWE